MSENNHIKSLVEVWKKTRESIEHFDKLLADFRKMAFTVNGIVITGSISLLLSPVQDKVLYVGCLCLGMNLINVVIWAVEKHYHLYLLVSARVAKELEDQLGLDESVKITYQLGKAKEREQPSIHFKKIVISFYDFIYLVPALVALTFAFFAGLRIWVFVLFILEILVVIWILQKHRTSEQFNNL